MDLESMNPESSPDIDQSMLISPKYRARDWNDLKLDTEADWEPAINMFEDRVRGRFLSIIAGMQKEEFAGFAVLALDCLLIETLQQFREGKQSTPRNQSCQYFVKFLTETSFSKFFTKETAKMFYKQFRCGILHQAEVQGTSLVHTFGVLVKPTEDSLGLVINRMLFHARLEKVFGEYVNSLRSGHDASLQKNFRRKMDYICRAPSVA